MPGSTWLDEVLEASEHRPDVTLVSTRPHVPGDHGLTIARVFQR
jgi:hypothetical protein